MDSKSSLERQGVGGVKKLKAAVGFEPTSHGFANQCLSPLGHAALRIADYIQNCGIIKDKAEKNKIWLNHSLEYLTG